MGVGGGAMGDAARSALSRYSDLARKPAQWGGDLGQYIANNVTPTGRRLTREWPGVAERFRKLPTELEEHLKNQEHPEFGKLYDEALATGADMGGFSRQDIWDELRPGISGAMRAEADDMVDMLTERGLKGDEARRFIEDNIAKEMPVWADSTLPIPAVIGEVADFNARAMTHNQRAQTLVDAGRVAGTLSAGAVPVLAAGAGAAGLAYGLGDADTAGNHLRSLSNNTLGTDFDTESRVGAKFSSVMDRLWDAGGSVADTAVRGANRAIGAGRNLGFEIANKPVDRARAATEEAAKRYNQSANPNDIFTRYREMAPEQRDALSPLTRELIESDSPTAMPSALRRELDRMRAAASANDLYPSKKDLELGEFFDAADKLQLAPLHRDFGVDPREYIRAQIDGDKTLDTYLRRVDSYRDLGGEAVRFGLGAVPAAAGLAGLGGLAYGLGDADTAGNNVRSLSNSVLGTDFETESRLGSKFSSVGSWLRDTRDAAQAAVRRRTHGANDVLDGQGLLRSDGAGSSGGLSDWELAEMAALGVAGTTYGLGDADTTSNKRRSFMNDTFGTDFDTKSRIGNLLGG